MRLRCLASAALIAGSALAAFQASSTTLACRAGVKQQVYDEASLRVPRAQAEALHKRLEAWGKQRGMVVSGVGSQARPGEPWKLSTSMQSKRFGVVLTVTTPARGTDAAATVENNCWAPQEDWRPHWRALRLKLREWGYLRPS
jgi:hypothetical protein